jgi:hypothetical protein
VDATALSDRTDGADLRIALSEADIVYCKVYDHRLLDGRWTRFRIG